MNDMDVDTNRLTVDGTPFTPAGLQVREVLDVTDDDVLCVVQRTLKSCLKATCRSSGSRMPPTMTPAASTWCRSAMTAHGNPLTYAPGQWSMSRAGNGCVVTGRGMDDATVQMQHCMNIATTDENGTDVASMVVAPIENHAETPDSRRTCTSPDSANVSCTRRSCCPHPIVNTRTKPSCRYS